MTNQMTICIVTSPLFQLMDRKTVTIIAYLAICKTGLFPAILGKGPWPKLGKNDRLNIKIG